MALLFAVIIGIEDYQALKPVLFAAKDAQAISAALVAIGCPLDRQLILLDGAATKTAIEAELRRFLLSEVPEGARCYIFFAGHGFSDGDHNYLAAHDTRHYDIADTAVRLQKILGLIKACPAKQTVLFLDACHTGVTVEDTMRSGLGGLELGPEEEFCAGFASCRAEEKSYSSKKLQQGIWTHHLLEALRGEVEEVLDGNLLLAPKLQRYLRDAVPKTLRTTFEKPPTQTPRFFGSYERVGAIADLSTVRTKRRADAAAAEFRLDQIMFVSTETDSVTSLPGFSKRKGHFVPQSTSSAASRFVQDLGAAELSAHVDSRFKMIRQQMGLKTKEVEADCGDGHGTIRTPGFDYRALLDQDRDEPGQVAWRYELSNLRDSGLLDSPAFNAVFSDIFDTVEFWIAGKPASVKKLAAALEEAGYEVDVPRDYSHCSAELGSGVPSVVITPECLEFSFSSPAKPKALAQGFRSACALLLEVPGFARILRA